MEVRYGYIRVKTREDKIAVITVGWVNNSCIHSVYYICYAICSPKDMFSKKIGRLKVRKMLESGAQRTFSVNIEDKKLVWKTIKRLVIEKIFAGRNKCPAFLSDDPVYLTNFFASNIFHNKYGKEIIKNLGFYKNGKCCHCKKVYYIKCPFCGEEYPRTIELGNNKEIENGN